MAAAQQMIGGGAIHRRRVDTRDARRVKGPREPLDATPCIGERIGRVRPPGSVRRVVQASAPTPVDTAWRRVRRRVEPMPLRPRVRHEQRRARVLRLRGNAGWSVSGSSTPRDSMARAGGGRSRRAGGRQPADDRFADAVVVGLDSRGGPRRTDQIRALKSAHQPPLVPGNGRRSRTSMVSIGRPATLTARATRGSHREDRRAPMK